MNSGSCPSGSSLTCKSISTTDSFDNTRDCLTNQETAADLFQKLRASFVSQSSLMKVLIQDLSGLTSETPHAKVELIFSIKLPEIK
jgi:hypothetical protein